MFSEEEEEEERRVTRRVRRGRGGGGGVNFSAYFILRRVFGEGRRYFWCVST